MKLDIEDWNQAKEARRVLRQSFSLYPESKLCLVLLLIEEIKKSYKQYIINKIKEYLNND